MRSTGNMGRLCAGEPRARAVGLRAFRVQGATGRGDPHARLRMGHQGSKRSSPCACQHVRELPPRRDVELAERPSEMGLHGFLCDEQRLGDLAVGAARRSDLDHAPLAGRQRVGAGALGGSGPYADRAELGPRAARQGRAPQRAASSRASSRGSRAAVRCPAARSVAPRSTRTRACSSRAGEGAKTSRRCLEPTLPLFAGGQRAHGRAARSRSIAPRRTIARGAPRRRPGRELLRHGRVRRGKAPPPNAKGRRRGFLRAENGMVEREAAQLLDCSLVVAGRGAKHARGVEEFSARCELGVEANPGAIDRARAGRRASRHARAPRAPPSTPP